MLSVERRRYTRASLRSCLEQAGMKVLGVEYAFFVLSLLRGMQKAWEAVVPRAPGGSDGVGDWRGSAGTSAALEWVLRADLRCMLLARRMGIRLPGLSCVAICQKQQS